MELNLNGGEAIRKQRGHAHFVVSKTQDDRSTTVEINEVHSQRAQRELELARMLGDRTSKVARAHAKELLDGSSQ